MPVEKAIFDKKNILVVGGAGFIGSHLCDELVKSDKVICIDNFLTGREDNVAHLLQHPDFEFLNFDISNPLNLEQLPELKKFKFEFQGVQEVYYLASPSSPADYQNYPIETLLANSVGLRNALDIAVKYKAKFFFASSPAVYGQAPNSKPVKEDFCGVVNQLSSRAIFAESKRFAETMVFAYAAKFGLDVKLARIFNCYGSRMRLDDGRMIPEMIRLALGNEDIVIYGTEKSTGSYFYVSDLIRGIVKLMESTEKGPINLSSDWKNKFSDVAKKIVDEYGSTSKIRFEAPKDIFADQLIGDISAAKEKLGWFPVILLDQGIKETIDYLEAQRGIKMFQQKPAQ
ncbi:MAG: NAD-dependent epimerase/dehydratase family protein [Candidatus Buchananbacteria bacterium]